MKHIWKLTVLAGTTLAIVFSVLPAQAEEPIPTDLSVSEAQRFLGTWKIAIDVMGRELELFINVVDVDGQVGATLDSPQQAEPLAISSVSLNEDEDIVLSGELTFGGSFTIDITITMHLETPDTVSGTVKDAGGLINAPLTGSRITQEELDSVQGRRPDPTEERVIYGDKRIRVQFADLEMGSSDWELFEELEPGKVYEFTLSRATKMYTDLDLDFGEGRVVKKENVAPDYPGVYSVWMKKNDDGTWSLVFNNQPDIWGTRHEAEFDAVEVPLEVSTLEEPVEKFKIEIDETDAGGTFKLIWADQQWSADYVIQ